MLKTEIKINDKVSITVDAAPSCATVVRFKVGDQEHGVQLNGPNLDAFITALNSASRYRFNQGKMEG